MRVQDLGKMIEADILIIGGGIAGLFCGIRAKERKPDVNVVLVDKCCAGVSGSSVFAAGIVNYWQPGDDFDGIVREIVVDNAEYLIDQDYVELAVKESYDRFIDLVELGVEFQKDEKGNVKRIQALAGKIAKCTPYRGGIDLTWKLRRKAEKAGVTMIDRIFANDLLMNDGRCVGAVGFHTRTGDFYLFKAKGTVIAGGTLFIGRPQMGPSGTTGDSQAMGFRAGLPLRNLEQVSTSHGPAFMPAPGLHVIFGSGGILVNSKGERFMQRYNAELLEESRRFDTARAILLEWKEGRGPCYLDCTFLSAEAIGTIMTALPLFASGLRTLGLDLRKDKIEYVPYGLNIQHQAGIRVNNADGDVGVQGLWVVGTAGDFCGGVDGTLASSLIGSAVQGARAGERAVEYTLYAERPVIDMAQVWKFRDNIYEPLEIATETTIETREATRRLWQIMMRYVNLIKDEAMLKRAIAEIAKLQEQFKKGAAKDVHELTKVHELRNMLTISELIAKSAIIRTESRRCHYRFDYPSRNDKTWLKWVVARLVNGRPEICTEEIPITKWKYKPSID